MRMQLPHLGVNTFRRFFTLAGWTLLSFALEKGAMMIIIFLLAKILGAQDYGRLTLAQGLVNSLQIFVVLGAGSVLVRYIPKMREEGLHRVVEIINLCAMVVGATILAFIILALSAGRTVMSDALSVLPSSTIPDLMVAWVMLTAINSLLLTIMLSLEKGRILGLISLLGAALSIALVPFAASRAGVQGVISALVSVELAKGVALALVYARFVEGASVPLLATPRRSDMPILVSFALPTFLTSCLWPVTMWVSQLIVRYFHPNGLTEVGAFGLANNIFGVVVLVSGLTNRAAMPIFSSLQSNGHLKELRHASLMMAILQTLAALSLSIIILFMYRSLYDNLSHEYSSKQLLVPIMVAVGIITAPQTSIGNCLLVLDRAYFILSTMCIWSVITLAGSWFFHEYGAYALAGSYLAAAIIRTALLVVGWLGVTTHREFHHESC